MPKYKILLVDYDPRSIKQSKELLVKLDCEVEVAIDGIAALNLFPQVKPDLIIIEAMLPKKHGFDVCHEIKKTPQGKKTPVIITTHVYKGRKYRHQAFHIYCCDEYIEKPVSDKSLLDKIKKFLPDLEDIHQELKEEKPPLETKPKAEEEVVAAEEKNVASEEKASIVSKDLEKEISSKVDEVLTLFSDVMDLKPSEKKEEAAKVGEKQKKKKKAKKPKKDAEVKPVTEIVTPVMVEEKVKEEQKKPQAVEAEIEDAAEQKATQATLQVSQEKSKETQEGEIVTEQITAKEEKMEKAEIAYQPEEEAEAKEPEQKVPEELLAVPPRKSRFFKSKVAVIFFSAVIFLGLIFILFLIFKNQKEKTTPIQSSASLSSEILKSVDDSSSDIESSRSDTVSPSHAPPQGEISSELDSSAIATPTKEVRKSKQPETPSKMSQPQMKPKERKKIKQEPKQTTSRKVPPVTDRSIEKIRAPSPKPDRKISISERKTITPSTENKQQKAAIDSEKISKEPPKKPIPEEAKASSERQTEEVSSIQTKKESKPEQDLPLAEKQSSAEAIAEPLEQQKMEEPKDISKEISQELQKQKEPIQDLPEEAPQAKETPLPKEGQLIDYSLLDREPPYLSHEPPKYPFMARLKGVEGKVILRLLIAKTGYVEKVELVKGLEDSIDEAAIEAARKWVYRPPMSQGIRVKTWKVETLTFPPK